jgi:hypothetical protein
MLKCARKARRDPSIRCEPVGVWDAKTQACIADALTTFEALCPGCAEQPECRSLGQNACPHIGSLGFGSVLAVSPTVFCETP